MNKTEERLRRAAAETRQLAEGYRPAPLPTTQRRPGNRGMLVLAAAFAVVLFVFGALPSLVESDPDSPPPLTSPLASPSSTTAGSVDPPSCSAAGFDGSVTLPELPAAVTATRSAVIDAALACDFEGLGAQAAENFFTSFGGGGAENLGSWEAEGRGELDTLLELLHLSHEVMETENGAIYVWPSAYAYPTWDEVPAEAIEELQAIHTPEEIESFATANAYLGWRTAIDSEGRWLYFIAGD